MQESLSVFKGISRKLLADLAVCPSVCKPTEVSFCFYSCTEYQRQYLI